MKIIRLDTPDSTNNYIREHISSLSDGDVVTSISQGKGKGRLGRSFFSYEGGLYFSIYRKIKKVEILEKITSICAYAVSKSILDIFNIQTEIKWVNDIILNDKKVCGILCESILKEDGSFDTIIGIGINVKKPNNMPEELVDKATYIIDNPEFDLNILLTQIINIISEILETQNTCYVNYIKNNFYLQNKKIILNTFNGNIAGLVCGIDNNCNLLLNIDGKIETIKSGIIEHVIY